MAQVSAVNRARRTRDILAPPGAISASAASVKKDQRFPFVKEIL